MRVKTEKVGEGVEMPALSEFAELFERSKDDRAMIVGSEVREVIGAYRQTLTDNEDLKIQVARLDAFCREFVWGEGESATEIINRIKNELAKSLTEKEELKRRVEKAESSRKHTQEWYASHYGRLQDWARKVLPEPYRNQFFSCVANGTYDAYLDVGEPYMCKAGFMVTPSGYMHMDDAKGQLVIDQTRRAENAEAELSSLRTSVVSGEWIDCRDGLPPMNPHNRCAGWDFSDRVEVVSEGFVCIGDMAIDIRNGETSWISQSGERLSGVTYWKNLPAPPKPIEREGGYTVIELLFGLIFVFASLLTGLLVFTGAHFIHKIW